jgi:hypothetical protein
MRVPLRLTSYTSRMDPIATNCYLWEAAVAIEASPTFYVPVFIGQPPVPYISAGPGFSNPTKEALDEAVRVWQLSGIGSIISLGTGTTFPARLDVDQIPTTSGIFQISKLVALIHTLSAIAIDTERVHLELARDANLLGLKYFRFSVSEGLQGLEYYAPSILSTVKEATTLYLQKSDVSNLLVFRARYLYSE